jgi:hypothetical protein
MRRAAAAASIDKLPSFRGQVSPCMLVYAGTWAQDAFVESRYARKVRTCVGGMNASHDERTKHLPIRDR